MISRLLALGALAVTASAIPLAPAQAEFFSYDEMRSMCRGDGSESAEFRTRAGYALLAESYRGRCRMYLLGQADAYLQREADRPEERACLRSGISQAEVADAVVEELLRRAEPPEGGVGEVVRDVLRSRFACG
jgi:hypothetical protein